MARILCSGWDGGGNVNVLLELGRRLVCRGHDVTMLGETSMVGRFERYSIRTQAVTDIWGPSFPDQLTTLAEDADVVLPDCLLPVDALRALGVCGTPTAAVVHLLPSLLPLIEATFLGAGYLEALDQLDRQLAFTVRELDAGDVARNVRYVGPLLEDEGPDAGWQPPGVPLVVVSLGTTPMDEAPVLQRVLDALAPLPVAVLATAGEHLDRSAIDVPTNASLVGLVRHAAVLPHADVFVGHGGHGGHGGIMAALAHGVPIVSVPLDRDQPRNAERLEALGAGITVVPDAVELQLRDAVERARVSGDLRAAARRMAVVIAGYGERGVDEVEALLT